MQKNKCKKKRIVAFIAKLSVFAAIYSAMILTNYLVDPGALYHTRFAGSREELIVDAVTSGKAVENVDDINERLAKRYCVEKMGEKHTIVLGSSRAALITAEAACDENLFNLSLSGAGLDDVVGIYGLYHMKYKAPARVIITLDPWLLNDNFSDARFAASLGDAYFYYLTEVLGYEGVDKKLSDVSDIYIDPDAKQSFFSLEAKVRNQIFSVPYFQASVKALLKPQDQLTAVTQSYWTKNSSLRADGSYCYPENYREVDIQSIKNRCMPSLPGSILGESNFVSERGKNAALLRDFLKSMIDDGVEVEALLIPINPILYEHMQKYERYAPYLAAESYFREMADELDIKILGSIDPKALNAEPADFYDGYHYRAERVDELLAKLAEVEK
ncbi:MAG: hypothetical protein RR368_00580 [Oscillospiraceae bacterium]